MANRYPVIVTNSGVAGDSAPFAFKEIPSGDDLNLIDNFIRIGSTSAAANVIKDANGNAVISFPSAVSSAVNYFRLNNSATGQSIVLEAVGGDTDVSIHLKPKGSSGEIIVGTGAAAAVIETSGNQNLVLRSGNSTTGSLTLTQGNNGDLTFTPAGTGKLKVGSNNVVVVGDSGVVSTTMIADANVTYAKIQNVAGLSIVGRSANSSGVAADITAGTDGHVLRLSGTTLGFGTIASAGIGDSQVTFSKIQNSASSGLSVIGRSANSAGAFAEIAAGTDGHVLYRASSTSLTFGQLITSSLGNNIVTYAKMQNVGTANRVLGSTTAGGAVSEVQVNVSMIDFSGGGTLTLSTSSATGLRIGGGTTQMLSFYNATPVVRQTAPATAASNANTTTLATAINSIRTALVNLGLVG